MSQHDDHDRDDIALIGEYALHLLDADDRLMVERRLKDEPTLRQLLREWDEGLIPLSKEMIGEAPPLAIKAKIEARLFPETVPHESAWQRLFSWRFAGLALATMLVLALIFGSQYFVGIEGPTYVAEIAAEDRGLVVQARFDPETARLDVDRIVGAAGPGRALELWLIAEGADAPVSLGVLSTSSQATVQIPDQLLSDMIGGTLAISDEPPGGSPTGAPTGAVLAVGALVTS